MITITWGRVFCALLPMNVGHCNKGGKFRMKKVLSTLLTLAMVSSLAACSGATPSTTAAGTTAGTTTAGTTTAGTTAATCT